ncbi:MAG: RNA methyltransferase [Myxococcota bacterium]
MPIERVEALADPRVDFYRELREGRLLEEHGLFVAESRHVVRRVLQGRRFRVRSVLLADGALAELRPELEALADPPLVLLAPHALLCEIAGYHVHQGCLAVVERGAPVPLDALARRAATGRGLIVGIERLGDPANVGSVFRNALAFGADAVLLAPGGAHPLFRKSVRVSMAATLAVPFAQATAWPGDLEKLRAEGYRILACVARPDATPLDAFARDASRVVLLFGSEGAGLDAATVSAADATLTIPVAAAADSVNVATASGIVLHHFARLRPLS